jgi:chaperonin cofactor prefoldin
MKQKKKIVQEFYKTQAELTLLDQQKKTLESQLTLTTKALEELPKISGKKVYKVINNVLIQRDAVDVIRELNEKKVKLSSQLASLRNNLEKGITELKKMGLDLSDTQKSGLDGFDYSDNKNSDEYKFRPFGLFD